MVNTSGPLTIHVGVVPLRSGGLLDSIHCRLYTTLPQLAAHGPGFICPPPRVVTAKNIIHLFIYSIVGHKRQHNTRKSSPRDLNLRNVPKYSHTREKSDHIKYKQGFKWLCFSQTSYCICFGFLRSIFSLQIICNFVPGPGHPLKKISARSWI